MCLQSCQTLKVASESLNEDCILFSSISKCILLYSCFLKTEIHIEYSAFFAIVLNSNTPFSTILNSLYLSIYLHIYFNCNLLRKVAMFLREKQVGSNFILPWKTFFTLRISWLLPCIVALSPVAALSFMLFTERPDDWKWLGKKCFDNWERMAGGNKIGKV